MPLRLAAIVLLALPATMFPANGEAAEVRFARDVAPLLKQYCATCHLTGDEPGSMALHPKGAYQSLVGVKSEESALLRVAPGKPDESYLYLKITGQHLKAGGVGEAMPFGTEPLSDADIALIRQWILDGARND